MTQSNLANIIDSLKCEICLDVVTLPVHGKCCVNSKMAKPACLSCVRNYLQLNNPISARENVKKSWNGCGCNLQIRSKVPATYFYEHTYQLDQIRNCIGPSICHHENCKAKCETAEELRRHLIGTSTSNDKNGNCLEAFTKCKYCNKFDKRRIIEEEHYDRYHSSIQCPLCGMNVNINNCVTHYNAHKIHINIFKQALINRNLLES
uniref:Regulatory protein n=1 Tax=Nucleocytoviricota sp. TaxID=2809609 RepID=A0A9E8JZ36_9VIRU|nr:regulatory protein [Nucleocytoviricota sp.]UZT29111.1 regulatory protein [Nucleocytoviricota sp.]